MSAVRERDIDAVEKDLTFTPSTSPLHRAIPACNLTIYNTIKQIMHLKTLHPRTRTRKIDRCSLVVRVGGVYSSEYGWPGPQHGAWGFYFGPGSRYNAGGVMPALPEGHMCRIRVDIEAIDKALDVVARIAARDKGLKRVRIACASAMVVYGLTRWLEVWVRRGRKRYPGGTRETYLEALEAVYDRVHEMRSGEDGLDIKFWHMEGANAYSDAIALSALRKRPDLPDLPLHRTIRRGTDADTGTGTGTGTAGL